MNKLTTSPGLADVAEHGGHFCKRCQRYVPIEDASSGYFKCGVCGSTNIRFDPPLPGFRRDPKV